MKSKLLLLLILTALCVSVLPRCNWLLEDDQLTKKEVRYIFLFDRFDETTLTGFYKMFYTKCDTLQSEITQRLPKGISKISIAVYNAANKSASPLVVSFSDQELKEEKDNKARAFISQLKKDMEENELSKSNFIFRNMERIVESLNDSSILYRVAFFSRLVENTGGVSGDGTYRTEATKGNFHFINSSDICIKDAIDAAEEQITNKSGWIYRHLVKPAQSNPLLSSIPISIYSSGQTEPRADENGYDGKTIDDFWNKLFEKMGLNVKRKGYSNLNSYEFFN